MELTVLFLGLVAFLNFFMVSGATVPTGITTGGTPETLPTSAMMYEGEFGGHKVKLNGTIQQVIAQVKDMYPDLDMDAILAPQNTTLATRDVLNKNGMTCLPIPGQDWHSAFYDVIRSGIAYLKKRSVCAVPARYCSRVSCSDYGAIWLCNDNHYAIYPACPYIASYAQDIMDNCGNAELQITGGQEFDSDNYNVIVRGDWDHC